MVSIHPKIVGQIGNLPQIGVKTKIFETITISTLSRSGTTGDGSEILKQPPGMYKTLVKNGINYQPQVVIAGFLTHQQYCHDVFENMRFEDSWIHSE